MRPGRVERDAGMDLATATARVAGAGKEQNRRVYRRHEARDPLFGVSLANLGIGISSPVRWAAAERVADRIGPVTVDHGETRVRDTGSDPVSRAWARHRPGDGVTHGAS
jgi:hypothetical protein